MRIDRDDESVLAALRFHHFPLRPQDLSTFTILPLEKIFSALQLLSAAGFVTLNRSANGRIQTARAVSFTL